MDEQDDSEDILPWMFEITSLNNSKMTVMSSSDDSSPSRGTADSNFGNTDSCKTSIEDNCRFATACVVRKMRVRRGKIDRLIGKKGDRSRIMDNECDDVRGVRIMNKDEANC
ncbi:hypothetical protein K503DRAFT_778027 [Rhizopogon vinicolor AM-OR11-026]|uniref:Uncharacterized protein n=1 Tax=Rhizopogon vinicolor AM-OR11-026 TaxID=1314800 RepID=A0A1B7MDX4_9AGAM|nr:hypothetical protein K503DRAFT_778027 [Rhizopogon vinicolor AM-OR11-026]